MQKLKLSEKQSEKILSTKTKNSIKKILLAKFILVLGKLNSQKILNIFAEVLTTKSENFKPL